MNFLKHAKKSLAILIILGVGGCVKFSENPDSGHYLRLSHGIVNVRNPVGSQTTFTVESDVQWKLDIQSPIPAWVTTDQQAGTGTQVITVTSTRDNPIGEVRSADMIATAVDQPSMLPVRIRIFQNDTISHTK